MVADTQDLRTRITKRLVGGGTRLAFNEALPHVLVRRVLEMIAPFAKPAEGCELQQGVIDTIPYDFWTPLTFVPGRVVLYSHGGGYTLFSRRTHQGLASRLAVEFAAQALVYDYRLAPEHKFPAAIDDALAAYGHLLKIGYLPQNIILAGDSAGGGITFALPLALRDLGLPLPGLLIGLSPWVDMTSSGLSMKENVDKDVMLNAHGIDDFKLKYLGNCDPKHPYVSPLFANLEGLPPVMLQAAGDEILRDDSVRLTAALRAAGVQVELDVWPGLFHVFEFAWRWLPQADEAIAKMGEFVRRHYKN